MKREIKGKLYCNNPILLQQTINRILDEFSPNCIASRPLPSKEGDYHSLFTIFAEDETGFLE
jgi:hypothetical protein